MDPTDHDLTRLTVERRSWGLLGIGGLYEFNNCYNGTSTARGRAAENMRTFNAAEHSTENMRTFNATEHWEYDFFERCNGTSIAHGWASSDEWSGIVV